MIFRKEKYSSEKSKILFFVICSLMFVIGINAQNKLDVIVLDAGHGGKDPGTIGDKTGVLEKNIVLPITVKLGEMIQKKFPSISIIYTRKTDEFIDLRERTKMANSVKGKLFVSIHANHKKAEETEKNGFEIYLLSKERFPEAVSVTMYENRTLPFTRFGEDSADAFIFSSLAQAGYNRFNEYIASIIESNLISYTKLLSRGMMQAGFWVIVGASMPAVLVETGYVSDENDELYLSSEKGQTDIAIGLLNAFQKYKLFYESQ